MSNVNDDLKELLTFLEMQDEDNLVPHLKLTCVSVFRIGMRDLKQSKKWFLNKSASQLREAKLTNRMYAELRKEVLNY